MQTKTEIVRAANHYNICTGPARFKFKNIYEICVCVFKYASLFYFEKCTNHTHNGDMIVVARLTTVLDIFYIRFCAREYVPTILDRHARSIRTEIV